MSASERVWLFEEIDRESMSDDEFLKTYLERLLEQYSYTRLSGLPEGQLEREFDIANKRFRWLVSQFQPDYDDEYERMMYQPNNDTEIGSLDEEQWAEINMTIRQIDRNLNKAVKDAYEERYDQRTSIGKFIVDLVGKLTPGNTQHIEMRYPDKSEPED